MKKYISNSIQLVVAASLGIAIGFAATYKNPEKTFLSERVDVALRPQVEEFLKNAHQFGVYPNLDNKYVVIGDPRWVTEVVDAVGGCDYVDGVVVISGNTWQTISLNENNYLTEQQQLNAKQQLIDHELGHCLLGRVHREGIIQVTEDRFIESSVMYPMTFRDYNEFSEFNVYYEAELFDVRTFNQLDMVFAFAGLSKSNAELSQ
jgi:hypothetical protein